MSRGGAETIPRRLRLDSAEPNAGLELTNHEIMTCVETKGWMLNRLSHAGAPILVNLNPC